MRLLSPKKEKAKAPRSDTEESDSSRETNELKNQNTNAKNTPKNHTHSHSAHRKRRRKDKQKSRRRSRSFSLIPISNGLIPSSKEGSGMIPNGVLTSSEREELKKSNKAPSTLSPALNNTETLTASASTLKSFDTDLVDYEESGSSSDSSASSSTSISCSDNESKDGGYNFQSHQGSSSSKQSGVSKNRRTLGKAMAISIPERDLDYHLQRENSPPEPCSSSTLRERQGRRLPSNPENLTFLNANLVPVYESELGDSTGANKAVIDGESVGDKGKEGEEGEKPSDKYTYSGVGRHFGKQLSHSSLSLGADAESVHSFGSGGGGSLGAEFLGWLMRLKAVTIVFLGTLLVLSLSSLLFVFPLVVDPILLGLEAQFSTVPANCKTINVRSAKGPSDCSLPSCRAGCTADLFQCIFIDVEYSYYLDFDLASRKTQFNANFSGSNSNNNNFNPDAGNASLFSNTSELVSKNATLFININGCGYPPAVNCSVFERIYGKVGTEFQCFYSARNESFVVPYYNHEEEKHYLFLAISVPVFLAIFSAIALFLLLKCFNNGKARGVVVNKSSSELKLVDAGEGKGKKKKSKSWKKMKKGSGESVKMNGIEAHKKDDGDPDQRLNGTVPKANGHAFQDTLAGLVGMTEPTKIQENIKKLPHQHDSLDKSIPFLNGSPEQKQRRPRYAKKSEVVKSGLKGSRVGTIEDEVLFTSANNERKKPPPKLQEHRL